MKSKVLTLLTLLTMILGMTACGKHAKPSSQELRVQVTVPELGKQVW